MANTNSTYSVYSADTSIAEFFESYPGASREECDKIAGSLLESSVTPVQIQGVFSYTVFGGSPLKIVQFRSSKSELNVDLLHLARSIHGEIVANTMYNGSNGRAPGLSVYVIEKLPGVTYMEYSIARSIGTVLSAEENERQETLVRNLASFFAASWHAPQPMDVPSAMARSRKKLDLLARKLPLRFHDSICFVRDNLSLITADTYPAVLTHGDLSAMNFLVDSSSGHLTGVIDWAEAEILPFGCALWGMENVFGYMDSSGWHNFDKRPELESLFWLILQTAIGEPLRESKAINVAKTMGVLFKYSFRLDENLEERVVTEQDSGVRFLDALILDR